VLELFPMNFALRNSFVRDWVDLKALEWQTHSTGSSAFHMEERWHSDCMIGAVHGPATDLLGQSLHSWNTERSLGAEDPANISAVVDLAVIEAIDKKMNRLSGGRPREVWRRSKTHTTWL
jgi:hypothetical protein